MLRNFTKALEAYKSELGHNNYWRYAKAQRLPKIITWIAQRPDLARALAEDALQLAGGGAKEPIVAQGKEVNADD